MIISHKYRFVFTFPTKVGSSSAQACIIESGILGVKDAHSSYRDSVLSIPKSGQNMDGITCADVRRVSKHNIPKKLGVDESGEFPLVRHATPEEMVLLGLLTEEQLRSYKVYTIFRDPIDRYISARSFGAILTGNTLNQEALKNTSGAVYPFLGKTLKDFITYNGQRLKNLTVFDTSTLDGQLESLISSLGGEFRPKKYKSEYRPVWATKNIFTASELEAVSLILKDDIEVYNEICKTN